MRVFLGMAQNFPQGAFRHLALFPYCFQGNLSLPQGNCNLFLLTVKCLEKFSSVASMLPERLAELDSECGM